MHCVACDIQYLTANLIKQVSIIQLGEAAVHLNPLVELLVPPLPTSIWPYVIRGGPKLALYCIMGWRFYYSNPVKH